MLGVGISGQGRNAWGDSLAHDHDVSDDGHRHDPWEAARYMSPEQAEGTRGGDQRAAMCGCSAACSSRRRRAHARRSGRRERDAGFGAQERAGLGQAPGGFLRLPVDGSTVERRPVEDWRACVSSITVAKLVLVEASALTASRVFQLY